jgi:hypothetical protein
MNDYATPLSRLCFTILCFSLAAPLHSAEKDKEVKHAVQGLAQNVANFKVAGLYVPDFLEADASRNDRSAYLAAVFAKSLVEQAGKRFKVVDRSVVQSSYDSLSITARDLQERGPD